MEETTGLRSGQNPSVAGLAGKYLTFRMADEEYGLEIMKVQEIIGILPVTSIPKVPAYVRGVINLRGRIIPTIDLRSKFGLPQVEDTDKTCIIVMELENKVGRIAMGIIVDEVAEVMDFNEANIDGAPDFGNGLDASFVLGMGMVNGDVKILLDIDQVLTTTELTAMEKMTKEEVN